MAVIKLKPQRTELAHLIPAVKPLKILIGSSYRAEIALTGTDGRALDLSPYDRASLATPSGLLLVDGGALTLGPNGMFVIDLSADETAPLDPTLTNYRVTFEAPGEPRIRHFPLEGPMQIARR